MIPQDVIEKLVRREDVSFTVKVAAELHGSVDRYYKERYIIRLNSFYMFVYCDKLEKWFDYELAIEYSVESTILTVRDTLKPVLNSASLSDNDFFTVCARGGVELVKRKLAR